MTAFPKVQWPANLFEPPRWKGGPYHCRAAKLPAFETRDALNAFLKENSPTCKVVNVWQCETCKMWHAYTLADCTGSSSGSGRNSNYSSMAEWQAYFAARTPGDLCDEQPAE